MLGNEDFQLITRALNRTYEQLSEQGAGQAGIQSIGTAREDLLQAMSHASSIERKLIVHTLYDR
ncbi:hypothetical protein CEF21_13790 [Bacillus sp. FJAT-42376]|uniref:hypothetical protein n=1 Tax=Bacillus sp. FJAT-42376 TaxID=2014076 RepID=UPI000F4FDF57|nr:hypothetical protein [Bacillus sp. FJAT-42376]AZB43288.1 hypothetical protein CEF21_13790 [Bacillus sp. FJAT-42376]